MVIIKNYRINSLLGKKFFSSVWGFEPERSCKKFQGVSLARVIPAQDVPRSAQAAWKDQTGCLRLEGESPLLRNGNINYYRKISPFGENFYRSDGDSNRSAPVKNSKALALLE
jgi:hypothetical protein